MNHFVPRQFILTFMISVTGFGSAGHLTIDPIGSHICGEPFTISGTKPENTSRIGIEVLSLNYCEYACCFGEMSKAKHSRFVLQYLSEILNTAPYGKLVRFNHDKTQSYQEYPPCPDHILSHPFVPSGPGNSRWSTRIGETGQGRCLQPGTDRILVWDGSDQILYSDTYQPNGCMSAEITYTRQHCGGMSGILRTYRSVHPGYFQSGEWQPFFKSGDLTCFRI